MHYRTLITLPIDTAQTSQAARRFVLSYLNEQGFASQNKRFSSGPADWFVIGGRWSGELQRALLGPSIAAEYNEAFKLIANEGADQDPYYTSREKSEELRSEQAKEAWKSIAKRHSLAKEIKNPYTFGRDQYEQEGYEDDAMVLTPELYTLLLKPMEGSDSNADADFLDTEYRSLNTNLIHASWIVVIDYHS